MSNNEYMVMTYAENLMQNTNAPNASIKLAAMRIGEILLASSLINSDQLAEALLLGKNQKTPLGTILLSCRYISSGDLRTALQAQCAMKIAGISAETAIRAIAVCRQNGMRMMDALRTLGANLSPDFTDISLLTEELSVTQKVAGVNQKPVAVVSAELAELHMAQGNYDVATSYIDSVLSIYENMFGPVHESVASVYSLKAKYTFDRGRYDDARVFLSRSIEIKSRVYGHDSAHSIPERQRLAEVAVAQQQYDVAAHIMRQISLLRTTFPEAA